MVPSASPQSALKTASQRASVSRLVTDGSRQPLKKKSAPSRALTLNLLFKSQLQTCENPRETAPSDNCAATGVAVETAATSLDGDLQSVIEQRPNLPPVVKAGIVAMVRASNT